MWRKRLKKVMEVSRGPTLLDVGAGIGTFLALARDRAGWEVTGTEVSTAAINLASQRQGISLLRGDAEDLPITPGSFEVVTLWHVLEHVASPSRLLRVCHDALAPGGFLVLAVPNDSDARRLPDRIKRAALRMVGRRRPPQPRYVPLSSGSEIHLSHFTLPVLKRLLRKGGLRFLRATVDDQYPEPSWRSELIVGAYRAILRVTGGNLGQAILVFARRD
jgi:SAM-dependent methyltransferase